MGELRSPAQTRASGPTWVGVDRGFVAGCDWGNSDATRQTCAGMEREIDLARGFLSGVRAGRRRIPT